MADKPSKVKMLYVPVYEHDTEIFNHLPPTAHGQWARQLILRQLQFEAQMLSNLGEGSGGEEVAREAAKKLIREEMGPILARMEDSMDQVITEKLGAVNPELIKTAVREAVQMIMTEQTTQPDSVMKNNSTIPGWKRGHGSTGGDWR